MLAWQMHTCHSKMCRGKKKKCPVLQLSNCFAYLVSRAKLMRVAAPRVPQLLIIFYCFYILLGKDSIWPTPCSVFLRSPNRGALTKPTLVPMRKTFCELTPMRRGFWKANLKALEPEAEINCKGLFSKRTALKIWSRFFLVFGTGYILVYPSLKLAFSTDPSEISVIPKPIFFPQKQSYDFSFGLCLQALS